VAAAEAVVAVAAAADEAALAFSVLDAFGGFAALRVRTPTLDGSVPLRVAKGCVPLLEGNAFGHQVVIERPIRLVRRLGRWQAIGDAAAEIERARRAALPMLRAQRLLEPDAWPDLDRGVVTSERNAIRIWTGLCVRPPAGAWLWIQSAANRRNVRFEVRERVVPDASCFVPLVLELTPAPGVREIDLRGEIACIGALQPDVDVEVRTIAERPEVADAHLRFYAQAYFEAKKRGEITRRYRRTIDVSVPPHASAGGCEVVELGPSPGGTETLAACLLPQGAGDVVPARYGRVQRRRFDALVDFAVDWNGHDVIVDFDRERLRGLASRIVDAFGPAAQTHPGAVWYLTKYFTPHPPGEPHFFVKPWAFTRTPPGWSCVLDGVHGRGYDVLRGVVHTDQFHATPAVFALREPRIEVAAGTPLLRVTPVPRRLLALRCDAAVLEGVDRLR
jgi:hypothetical protein